MSLIICSECRKQISDKATHCIGCGCPISIILKNSNNEVSEIPLVSFHDFALTEAMIYNNCEHQVFMRGKRYYYSSHVVDLKKSNGEFTAKVTGSNGSIYDCKLVLSVDGIVNHMCSCPAHAKMRGLCKHLVAVSFEIMELPENKAIKKVSDIDTARKGVSNLEDSDKQKIEEIKKRHSNGGLSPLAKGDIKEHTSNENNTKEINEREALLENISEEDNETFADSEDASDVNEDLCFDKCSEEHQTNEEYKEDYELYWEELGRQETEVREYLVEYAENILRSFETGWFYSDDEGENKKHEHYYFPFFRRLH